MDAALVSEKNPDARGIGGWVGPIAGPDVCERRNILPLPGFKPLTLQPEA